MKKMFLIILACLGATSSFAGEPNFGGGAGMTTCADFAKAYKEQPELMESFFFSWAQGYMTGWNIASSERFMRVDLIVWPVEAQQARVRDYCDAHPLKSYLDAVRDLMIAMKPDDVKAHTTEHFDDR